MESYQIGYLYNNLKTHNKMQTVLTYLALLLTGLILQAQNTLEVNLTGFDTNQGTVFGKFVR